MNHELSNPQNLLSETLAVSLNTYVEEYKKKHKFLSYPALVNAMLSFLKAEAKKHLPEHRVKRLVFDIQMDRDNGLINVGIEERQLRFAPKEEKQLAIRMKTEIVLWIDSSL